MPQETANTLTASDEEARSPLARKARMPPYKFRVLFQSLLKQHAIVHSRLHQQKKEAVWSTKKFVGGGEKCSVLTKKLTVTV